MSTGLSTGLTRAFAPPRASTWMFSLAFTAAAQDPATLTRAYVDSPTPSNRSALLQYASAHKGLEGGVALLAIVGHDAAPDASTLREAEQRIPQLVDYTRWLSATTALANGNFAAAAQNGDAIVKQRPKSPLLAQAALLAAQAYLSANSPARAVDVLRRAKDDLPQPAGDLALAGAFEAAHDVANALAYYRRVWLEYPASEQARVAEAGQGTSQPPSASALLVRATKLMDAREFHRARRDFTALAAASSGLEHDFAVVRIGVVDQLARKNDAALSYLQSVTVTPRSGR